MKKTILATLFFQMNLQAAVYSSEIPKTLKEAEKLYQNGKYSEASDKALEYQKLSPNNLQALIILGMSDFYLNNYRNSKNWFQKAKKQSPNHPIVCKYLDLLKELEYRSGSFSIEPQDKDPNDSYVSAKYFKRGYFGHAFPNTSLSEDPGASTKLLEPILIKTPISSESIRLPSELATKTPYPSVESIFSSESYVEQMAREAFESGKYQKSYLLYSQLAASEPKNRSYLIAKAESAFKMRNYSKVMEILLPISTRNNLETLSVIQRNKVINMIEKSANKKYIPGQNNEDYK